MSHKGSKQASVYSGWAAAFRTIYYGTHYVCKPLLKSKKYAQQKKPIARLHSRQVFGLYFQINHLYQIDNPMSQLGHLKSR